LKDVIILCLSTATKSALIQLPLTKVSWMPIS